jgi:hypothetical protein
VLGDQFHGGGLVIDRQRDDLGIHVGESLPGPLERAELGVAVGTPRTSVEQDDAGVAAQSVRQLETAAAGKGDGKGRELIARMKQCHGSLRFWRLMHC